MKAIFVILGVLLLAASGGVIYLTVKNNQDDPDTTQIILNSIASLIGIIVAILCFVAATGKCRKKEKSLKFSVRKGQNGRKYKFA